MRVGKWLGGLLVRAGLRLIGEGEWIRSDHDRDRVVEDDDDESPIVMPPVVISDAAKAMVADLVNQPSAPKPVPEPPLRGSAQERHMRARARREM